MLFLRHAGDNEVITNTSGIGLRASGVCTALATGSVFGQVSPTYAPDAVCVKWVDENAAGNFAFNLDEPGAPQIYPQVYPFDNMIVVGNSNHQDGLTESCRGQISVDLFAPGDGLPFPNHGLIALNLAGNPTAVLAGTSAAAPIVTAIAALRWSLYPAETPSGIRQKLIQSVDQVPALFECVSGGRLNAAKALGGSCD